MKKSFSTKAWNNGDWSETGGGYGLTVSLDDRDEFFKREWGTVTLRLVAHNECPARIANPKIDKDSFWKNPPQRVCSHLINNKIRRWLIDGGFVNLEVHEWSTGKGSRPKFRVFPTKDKRVFEVRPESFEN